MQQEFADLEESFAEPAATIASLEQQLVENSTALAASKEQISDLQSSNQEFAKRMEQYKSSLPLTWVGGAALACLLVGFLGGLWWTDYRSRKRHGGIRIY